MIRDDYTAWDECPDVDNCSMVKDIQHLKAETVKARYELSQKLDPEHQWTTGADILSDLDTPHYDNLAYQEYMRIYYDGGDPMSFKEHGDSMIRIAQGQDDNRY